MTLKEELSLSRRNAVNAYKKVEDQADDEVRKMFKQCAEPLLRIMHEMYPMNKNLEFMVRHTCTDVIEFHPKIGDMFDGVKFVRTHNIEVKPSSEIDSAFSRVCSEFDIKMISNLKDIFIFRMTLND